MSVIPEPGASISVWPAALVFYGTVLVALALVVALMVKLVRRRRA